MFAAGATFTSSISGWIPAMAVLIAGSVIAVIQQRRNKKEKAAEKAAREAEKQRQDAQKEDTELSASVKEMTEFLAGAKATMFKPAQPGFVERFNNLETKVDGHGSSLEAIQLGIEKLAAGQDAAAKRDSAVAKNLKDHDA